MGEPVILNGAARTSPAGPPAAPSPLDEARAAYFKQLEVRVKADASPLNAVMLRAALDMNEALLEGLLDLLVSRGALTRDEIHAAQTKRLNVLTEIIRASTKAALDAQRRVEIARTMPPGRG